MSKLGNAKILGGIGAILTLIGSFFGILAIVVSMLILCLFAHSGSFFGILAIVGLVMLFIAVKYVAEEAKEENIFKNYLMYFIFSLVAIIAGVAIIFVSIGGSIFNFTKIIQEISEETKVTGFTEGLIKLFAGIIFALIVAWILMIIASVYLRKSYDKIAEYSKVDLFRTTGMFYFIGAITLIIIVGAIIIFIAKILEIVSFFSLPEEFPKAEAPVQ
ncbi:MAG: DUF996 domain-containing protein [Thermoplasmatales archaeon]|nr:DUF996 domain-containing protein [Thermoplasmatales archaeon]